MFRERVKNQIRPGTNHCEELGSELIQFGGTNINRRFDEGYDDKKWMRKWRKYLTSLVIDRQTLTESQEKFMKYMSWRMKLEAEEKKFMKYVEQEFTEEIKENERSSSSASRTQSAEQKDYDNDIMQELVRESCRVNNLEFIVQEMMAHTQSNMARMIQVEAKLEKIVLQLANIELRLRQ